MINKRVRCAVYTRKSSEEGLEQSFNSLEAQREACDSFVLSQRHEGWTVLDNRYDDGGFSGGTMERPALTQMLADIAAGKIDTVIVYKVDRLTRSLADFAKMIEVFDSHHVSFLSVTQPFNTTSSMGRLTLNVLLSFAQFEREVTGERIRDKVAASKKKGMWMGGVVPQGYDCIDRRLVVNHTEAHTVRTIFEQYLRLGCVRKLRYYLHSEQLFSKLRTSSAGQKSGGGLYSRGALYHLLRNRVYVGKIVHRGTSYSGQHEPIIAPELWDQVQVRLEANRCARRIRKSPSSPSLLSGIVFDTAGVRFTPTHAVKKGQRYRYYTSQAAIHKVGIAPTVYRLPAAQVETLVASRVHQLLETPEQFTSLLDADPDIDLAAQKARHLATEWHQLEIFKQHDFIRHVIKRVIVGQTTLWVEVNTASLLESLLERKPKLSAVDESKTVKVSAEFRSVRRGAAVRLLRSGTYSDATPVCSLVKAVARAHCWYQRILAGQQVRDIARQTGLSTSYVNRILQSALISPQLTADIVLGKHGADLTLEKLTPKLPSDWRAQKI